MTSTPEDVTRRTVRALFDAIEARDLDLIAPMAAKGLVAIYVSITTLDPQLARTMEPLAAAPHRRLKTIETLAKAGVPVGVSVSPMIPGFSNVSRSAR